MFDYKHLQVQVAHPEACEVGPGVRKCVPNLPDTAAGYDNSPSHTQAAMLPQHKLPRWWVPELLHSCLLALLIKSKDIIPCSPGKPQHPLVQDLILHGTSLCSAAGTGDSIPSRCWNPSPCNSDKCTSEGELHLVQGAGIPPGKTVHQTSSLGTWSGFFPITCRSGQAPDRVKFYLEKQIQTFFSIHCAYLWAKIK